MIPKKKTEQQEVEAMKVITTTRGNEDEGLKENVQVPQLLRSSFFKQCATLLDSKQKMPSSAKSDSGDCATSSSGDQTVGSTENNSPSEGDFDMNSLASRESTPSVTGSDDKTGDERPGDSDGQTLHTFDAGSTQGNEPPAGSSNLYILSEVADSISQSIDRRTKSRHSPVRSSTRSTRGKSSKWDVRSLTSKKSRLMKRLNEQSVKNKEQKTAHEANDDDDDDDDGEVLLTAEGSDSSQSEHSDSENHSFRQENRAPPYVRRKFAAEEKRARAAESARRCRLKQKIISQKMQSKNCDLRRQVDNLQEVVRQGKEEMGQLYKTNHELVCRLLHLTGGVRDPNDTTDTE